VKEERAKERPPANITPNSPFQKKGKNKTYHDKEEIREERTAKRERSTH